MISLVLFCNDKVGSSPVELLDINEAEKEKTSEWGGSGELEILCASHYSAEDEFLL